MTMKKKYYVYLLTNYLITLITIYIFNNYYANLDIYDLIIISSGPAIASMLPFVLFGRVKK